jgi:drug/metabolite transporter (DMT)-like permease
MPRQQRLFADGSLLAVALVWGLSFVVMKDLLVTMSPMLMVLLRQLLAFAVVAPLPHALGAARRRDWVTGGALGLVLSLAWIAETFGLAHTTPGKAGFIISLSVAMVPFMAAAVTRRRPVGAQVAGALVATAGLAALSLRGDLTLSFGDGLCLLAAGLFACQIVGVGLLARHTPPLVLTVTQLAASAAFFCLATPFVDPLRLPHAWQSWADLVFLGVCAVSGPFFVQAWAQRIVVSSEAAILLSFTGLFAGVFAVLLWGEPLTWHLLVGAAGITAGLLILELLPGSGLATDDGGGTGDERSVSPPRPKD